MTAGQQPTLAVLNNQLTSYALQLRELMQNISSLNKQVGKLGASGVQALGATSADASDIVAKAAILNTPAAIYFGTATQASTFDFNDALASLWAGQ